jgi:hypothetical protein
VAAVIQAIVRRAGRGARGSAECGMVCPFVKEDARRRPVAGAAEGVTWTIRLRGDKAVNIPPRSGDVPAKL